MIGKMLLSATYLKSVYLCRVALASQPVRDGLQLRGLRGLNPADHFCHRASANSIAGGRIGRNARRPFRKRPRLPLEGYALSHRLDFETGKTAVCGAHGAGHRAGVLSRAAVRCGTMAGRG